jgi:cation diffusion facilitator family transporter
VADTEHTPYEESQRGAWLSIAAYILLTAAKLGIGWWSGSKGVVADGVNNLTDVLGSAAVLMGLRIAVRPADEDHRYGHQKSETVAAIIAAAIMGLIGLNVAVSAGKAVFYPNLEVPRPAAIWVGAGSALVMLGVYCYNIRLARRTGSKALEAAAFDNRSDAYTSLGSVAGIIGAHLGWLWLDPIAGFVIALIILRTAWHIGAGAAHALTDGFDTTALGQIRQRVAAARGVLRIHDLRARYLGNTVAVEVTVGVSKTLSIVEAHRVSDEVEQSLLGYLDIGHVHVHVEPEQREADVQVG